VVELVGRRLVHGRPQGRGIQEVGLHDVHAGGQGSLPSLVGSLGPDRADHVVAARQQRIGHVRAVLAQDPGDEGAPTSHRASVSAVDGPHAEGSLRFSFGPSHDQGAYVPA
jgi:hypothetical protein